MVDPDVMVDVIESGVWDLIGAARPSIADPFLPRKIEQGRYDEIRACIGCNACYATANRGGHLGCTQNATAGEEHRRGWHPERFERAANADREVLVVGAGPSGLECAIVLAKRGFERVRLVDAADDIGGCMRWIPQLPGLDAWSRFVEWRRRESGRLPNLEIETGLRLSAAEIRASGAGLVVVATGARWAGDGFNGVSKGPIPGADATLPHMLTPEQIMLGGKTVPGKRVVVIDVESYHLGASLALRLAAQGHDVAIATPSESIATWCTWTLEGPRLRAQLHSARVAMHTDVSPEAIVPGRRQPAQHATAARPSSRGRCGRARDAAALQRGALPRARGRPAAASRRSTARAIAWRRAGSSTPSSTVTGWRARSTPRTPRCTCRLCASASFRHSAAAMSLTFVTGGARSGKSAHALRLALAADSARCDDRDGRGARCRDARAHRCAPSRTAGVVAHGGGAARSRRCAEGPRDGRVRRHRLPLAVGLEPARARIGRCGRGLAGEAAALAAAHEGGCVAVSSEVGMGIVPDNALARSYRDVLGRVNAIWAEAADDALLAVSGRVLRLERA